MKLSRRRALMAATAATLLEAPAFAATPKSQTTTNSWDRTCDVVVAGGGAAGVMAAIHAAKTGASVLLMHLRLCSEAIPQSPRAGSESKFASART